MTEHTNKQFSAELENVRSSFLQMGGLVEAMIGEAMNVLVNKEVNQADTVHDREKEVNRLEVEIDERIGLLIARNQPTAVDLRLLLSVSKMLTDMERCGDEADKIAKMARRIHEAGGQYIPAVELRHISTQVTSMIRNVLDAFAREDPIHAATVVRNDKEVDKEWKASLRHLITYMMEDPRTISRSIDLIFIARSL